MGPLFRIVFRNAFARPREMPSSSASCLWLMSGRDSTASKRSRVLCSSGVITTGLIQILILIKPRKSGRLRHLRYSMLPALKDGFESNEIFLKKFKDKNRRWKTVGQ